MELGSKAPLEDLGLNRKKMLYLLRLKKRKLAIDIFIDHGGMFEVTYNGFNFLDEKGGWVILT